MEFTLLVFLPAELRVELTRFLYDTKVYLRVSSCPHIPSEEYQLCLTNNVFTLHLAGEGAKLITREAGIKVKEVVLNWRGEILHRRCEEGKGLVLRPGEEALLDALYNHDLLYGVYQEGFVYDAVSLSRWEYPPVILKDSEQPHYFHFGLPSDYDVYADRIVGGDIEREQARSFLETALGSPRLSETEARVLYSAEWGFRLLPGLTLLRTAL